MKHSAFLVFLFLLVFLTGAIAWAVVPRATEPYVWTKYHWGSLKEGDFYQEQPFDPYSQGPMGGAVTLTIHHTYLPKGTIPPNRDEDIRKVQSIQRYHISRGWGDVGYHYLIGSDGTVYQGRPIEWQGTHAPPNPHNIGVCVIGDFEEEEFPSDTQLSTLVKLVAWLCDIHDIDPKSTITLFERENLGVSGHRDWGRTGCPGDRLYALLPSIRERIRSEMLSSAGTYDARFSAYQELPQTLLEGKTYQLPLTVRNVGFAAWSPLFEVGPVPLSPCISINNPVLDSEEMVNPLTNRLWEADITAKEAGDQRIGVRMAYSGIQFGEELAWDVKVLPASEFISQWLVAGPFPADTPDAAFATDYFAGRPVDVLDIMDEESEAAHDYSVTGEYQSGERNYRGEDGERVTHSGRYFRGEESFRMSLADYQGGPLVLRKLTDAGVRDQVSYAYVNDQRLAFWRSLQWERYRRWKNMDLVIPAHYLRGRDSIDVRIKSVRTKAWGCASFRYELLDFAEPLVSPRIDDNAGEVAWKTWKSDRGIVDLSSMLPNADSGAAYLAVYVRSPATGWVELRTGYAGYQKAWLNGVQVLAGRPDVTGFPDTMRGEALLREGWNRFLLKIALEPEAKALYVRLCDRDGKPLKGLRFGYEPGGPVNPEWVALLSSWVEVESGK